MKEGQLIVQGHRGCRAKRPENSIEGVKEAFLLGAFAVEVDVRPTADRHFAIVHDPVVGPPYYLSPKGEDAKRVVHTPSSSVQRISFGHVCAEGFSQQKLRMTTIPLLQKLLNEPGLLKRRLNLELKNDAPDGGVELDPDTYIRRFCAEIEDVKPTAIVWRIKSFDHELIRRLREVRLNWPLHYLAEEPTQIDNALRLHPVGLSVRADLVNESLVARCAEENVHLSVWTVNSRSQARRLFQLGVRDFVSDDPAVLLEELVPERG